MAFSSVQPSLSLDGEVHFLCNIAPSLYPSPNSNCVDHSGMTHSGRRRIHNAMVPGSIPNTGSVLIVLHSTDDHFRRRGKLAFLQCLVGGIQTTSDDKKGPVITMRWVKISFVLQLWIPPDQ